MKRLTIRGAINTFTGFGQMLVEVFAGLEARGVFCSLRPSTGTSDEAFGAKVPLEVKARMVASVQPEEYELLIRSPWEVPTPGKKTFFYTMWESTVLPKEYVEILNKAHHVIVPSRWQNEGFKASGVKVPISVIPLGMSPQIFSYIPPRPDDGKFIVGVAGRVSHGPNRKGIRRAIDMFLKTFEGKDDVQLQVKVHPDCDIGKVNDPKVKVIREHYPWHKVRQWLAGLDVFLSLARVEGFGLWQLQAMATGRAVIAAPYAGLTEFFNHENGYAIPFHEVHNEDYKGGFWAEMEDDDIRDVLLRAWSLENTKKGQLAAEVASRFTWDNSVQQLYWLFEHEGVWQ